MQSMVSMVEDGRNPVSYLGHVLSDGQVQDAGVVAVVVAFGFELEGDFPLDSQGCKVCKKVGLLQRELAKRLGEDFW